MIPKKRKPWLWKIELEDIQRIDITHSDTSISYKRDGRTWVIEDGNDTPVYQPQVGGQGPHRQRPETGPNPRRDYRGPHPVRSGPCRYNGGGN